ncbi:MAG: chorismate lyase [Cyanobacteria bacterium MAG CAR2_bin_4]|nr:chorismate lyase [Cyanobacteria bacterium MAG CAR2_bin_4]
MVLCSTDPHLHVLWTASRRSVLWGEAPVQLSPSWRLMLMGDGSPTRHLQLLTGQRVEVDLIGMEPEVHGSRQLPDEVTELSGPLLRRRVWLRCGAETLMWAESWWNQQDAQGHLRDLRQPIWASLCQDRVELFREVDGLGQVESEALEQRFSVSSPLWCRHYRFFKGGRVLTVIREVFSPALETYLGSSSMADPSSG